MTATLSAAPTTALPEPDTCRWRPLRAGVQNIWQYDHTTRFVFHGGRLLLRGRNGSGKTKAVEVLLPFLLEGRLDPARLDPFRSRSRKMHYNLLHEGNRDLSSNVGYVWLEFGRRDDDGNSRFATVGAGLKARRSDDRVDSWFFVADDVRVDRDLHLLDTDRRPLSKAALGEVLGDAGRVLDSQRDYRAAVNRTLFQMPSAQYEALVEALLRLRQPHLSERLDPAQVGAVLAESLPPLDAEKVHEVAEGFERLEAHRRDLADRRSALEAVETFLDAYGTYAATVAAVRARELTRADSAVRDAAAGIAAAEQARDEAAGQVEALEAERRQVRRDRQTAATRVHTLETSDEYRAVQQLEQAEIDEQAAAQRCRGFKERLERDREAAAKAARAREQAEAAVTTQREIVTAEGRTAQTEAARADLTGAHGSVTAQVDAALDGRGDLDSARGTADSLHRDRTAALTEIRAAQEAVIAAERTEQRASERVEDGEGRERTARERVEAAEAAVAEALGAFGNALEAWTSRALTCALDDDAVAALANADPSEVAARAREFTRPTRERLQSQAGDLEAQRGALVPQREAVAAERDALTAATHEPPPTPAWRGTGRDVRAGAPLYLLAEPSDALDGAAQAHVEAALEAAGLLDAWVTPQGDVLAAGELDAALVSGPRAEGRTLADVLEPTPSGGVDASVVAALLSRVSLLDGGEPPAADHVAPWVAVDGRFGIGPLRGKATREAVTYLGATAREQARARRLAALDAELANLDRAADQLVDELAAVHAQLIALDAELAAVPSDGDVRTARAEARAAAGALDEASSDLAALRGALADAEATAGDARRSRDETAGRHGLAAHVERLDALAAATAEWKAAVTGWLSAASLLTERLAWLSSVGEQADQAAARVHASAADAAAADTEHAAAVEQADTLRSMVGAEHQQVVDELHRVRGHQRELDERGEQLVDEVSHAREQRAVAEAELTHRQSEHEQREHRRRQAADEVRGLGELGVLRIVLDRELDDPGAWSLTVALERAREVAKAGPRIDDDPEAARRQLEVAENHINRRHQELLRDLVGGIRLLGRKDRGVLVYDVQHAGQTFSLPGLAAELRDDVAERDRRLDHDEQQLLETFLEGELHEHLRARIRDAAELVDVVNGQLADCPTASGQRIRLRWDVADDAPAGTQQAIALLLKGAGLLTAAQREELRAFLQVQLRDARDGDAATSLHDRIGAALDYRRWHGFTVMVRDPRASTARPLTRQSHATGSGGEKAVMLHLPLFAAMAAHYRASPHAPRLIVLDEVFAGIDRGTRGQLMGLLVQLDLDALLTSHEEWGFYAELDGLSTYQLVREPDLPGVLTEWFVWDGATRWELTG